MYDNINKPFHYTSTKLEVIDAIETWQLGFHLGNVLKYLVRAGKKMASSETDDLKKAAWYLQRYITLREKELRDAFYHVDAVDDLCLKR